MRIFIIGFMGSGKSTLSRPIAQAMECEFIDLDHYIERQEEMTIPDIFKQQGEPYFREVERKALQELCQYENIVVATGGGTPCYDENMALMNSVGKTVYLKQEPELLVSRLLNSHRVRPLIVGMNRQQLMEYVEGELEKREKYYNQATIKVTNAARDAERVITALSYYRQVPAK